MGVIIQRGMFGEDNGQIQWFGIIATTNSSCECRALEGSTGLEEAVGYWGIGQRGGVAPLLPLMASWLYSARPCALLVKRPPQEAINHTWYHHYYHGHDSYLAILLPNPFYPGPWAVPQSWMVLVGTDACGQTQEICNGPLKPGAQYR